MKSLAEEIMALKFCSLLMLTDNMYVSQKKAVRLVRGEKRLQRLMDEGRIRYEKPFGAKNTMWKFNLSDIIRNVKADNRLSEINCGAFNLGR